jgi:hypothetical protein
MLTVWRVLHVEADAMSFVSGNEVTGLVTSVSRPIPSDLSLFEFVIDRTLEGSRFIGGKLTLAGGQAYRVLNNFRTNGKNRVQVEATSLPVVPSGGIAFTLVDDDDFENPAPRTDTTFLSLTGDTGKDVRPPDDFWSRVQWTDDPELNPYAPAYMRLAIDGGCRLEAIDDSVTFQLNIAHTDRALAAQLAAGRDSTCAESDDYWVAYLQFAYQPGVDYDYDPAAVQTFLGFTPLDPRKDRTDSVTNATNVPRGAEGAFVFVETTVDASHPANLQRSIVVPHEIAHQLGIAGDAESGQGIMSYDRTAPNQSQFIPAHLNILRWRTKSPGR